MIVNEIKKKITNNVKRLNLIRVKIDEAIYRFKECTFNANDLRIKMCKHNHRAPTNSID